jgi:hypothetical protein
MLTAHRTFVGQVIAAEPPGETVYTSSTSLTRQALPDIDLSCLKHAPNESGASAGANFAFIESPCRYVSITGSGSAREATMAGDETIWQPDENNEAYLFRPRLKLMPADKTFVK